jgi:hypothetical protein
MYSFEVVAMWLAVLLSILEVRISIIAPEAGNNKFFAGYPRKFCDRCIKLDQYHFI